MFEFVRKHTRLFQFLLVLLVFPSFIFLGVQGYMQSNSSDGVVAKVGSMKITQPEWDQAQRIQLERMRQQMPNVPTDLLNSPEMRRQALDELIRQRVILSAADRLNLVATDERLKTTFESDPQFEFLRNPDKTVNRTALAAQGLSAQQFELRLRQDLVMQQVMLGVASSSVAPQASVEDAIDAMFQQREVKVQRFAVKDYAAKVSPSDADIAKYYDDPAHGAQFQAPESASIQYVVLDLDAIKSGITVSDDDLRKTYDQNKSRYASEEQRRASHILFKADKSMPEAERAKVKAQAESVLAEARKNPKSFPELAKKYSADPGSAEKGGDLDYFGRGAMVKPFEDTAFSLKMNQISDVVESDFGYHIIMLTGIKPATTRAFEQVKPELLEQARAQLAQQKFSEVAEQFTNTVYEQSDSLQPAVDKYKLPLRSAQNISRVPAPGATAPLNNDKFIAALFDNDSLRNKRNTQAIETGPNQLVSGRVVDYQPAHKLPLADVKDKVRDALVATRAEELARKDGEARLAALKQGAAGATAIDGDAKVISRAQPQGYSRALLDAALSVDASKLPAFVGVDVPGEGYSIVQVDKVLPRDPKLADPAAIKQQYAQVWGAAEMQAYYTALKTKEKVEVLPAGANAAAPSEAPLR